VGESGCGKSTGRSLLRLVECQGGAIEFGRNILQIPATRRRRCAATSSSSSRTRLPRSIRA
jgi:ABC-type oligopeptide transport system ATPase subunit